MTSFFRLTLCGLVLAGALGLKAQNMQFADATSGPFTPENLISNIFLGNGVEILNINFTGNPLSVGYFTDGQNYVGLERGIVMSTGRVLSVPAGVWGVDGLGDQFASTSLSLAATFDPVLASELPGGAGSLFDLCRYEITFVPVSDTLRFRYVFGSEEYPEYGCSNFNDIFGFFIQGPNFPDWTNIALIPNTALAVSINNLHPQNPNNAACTPLNAQYYVNNNGINKQPAYDGFTTVLTAEAIVIPCQQYTIRLSIADVGDPIFDSGVFLEAKSFGTGLLRVNVATPGNSGAVAEGCASGILTFSLASPAEQDIPLDYNIWGSAVNGVDYEAIPTNLFIPQGESSISIPITAFEDNIAEGEEIIAIDIQRTPCSRDTIYISTRENILLPPTLGPDTGICVGAQPLTLNGTSPTPLPNPPTFTNTQDVSIAPTFASVYSDILVSGVQPAVLGPGIIRSVCFNITHTWVDDLDIFLVSPGGKFLELTTDNGGNGDNYTNACFTETAAVRINFPGPVAPASAAPFTGDWLPEGPWSDLWDAGAQPVNGVWRLLMVDDSPGFTGTLRDWTITFEPAYRIDYEWSPAAGLSCAECPITEAQPVGTTNYVIKATDYYGCVAYDSVAITINENLPAPSISCADTILGGVAFEWGDVPNALGYEYRVNGGPWITALPGNFSFQQTGLINGDETTFEVRAISPYPDCEPLIGSATCIKTCAQSPFNNQITPPTCTGAANGAVQILTNTSIPPYTFTLNGLSNADGFFDGLAAGTYPASILNGEGCETLSTIVIPEPDSLQANIALVQEVSCFGGADGAAIATSAGGTGMSAFVWSDGQTGPVATGLSAGAYSVTATDQNGCTAVATTQINTYPPLQAVLSSTAATCHGQATGALSVVPSGGTGAGYAYQWNDPDAQTAPVANNLAAGSYQVTISDANGCSLVQTGTVAQPDPLLLILTGVNPACNAGVNGAVSATAQGGVGGYAFVWDNNQSGPTITGLGAGIYAATLSDANGCTTTQSYTLLEPDSLSVSASGVDIACHAQSSGSISLNATGGSGGYQVQWSGPNGYAASGAQIAGLAAGTYNATVSDAQGCTALYTLVLAQPSAPLSLSLPNPAATICHGASDGVAAVSASGGTPPYSYAWSANGQTTPAIANLAPGAYAVTMSDAQGCTAQAATLIEEKGAINAEITLVPPRCHNGDDGRAIVSAAFYGSNPAPLSGFVFAWSTIPAQTSATATELRAESQYTVTLTDAQGCTGVQTIAIGNTPPMSAAIVKLSDVRCHGDASGSAQAFGAGGLEPYAYLWSPGPAIQTAQTAENLKAGIYKVTVTDANGCAVITSVEITEPPALTRQISRTPVACFGESTGAASVSASGGAPPYQYVWNIGAIGASITQLPAGDYAVTVTDANGCTAAGDVAITQPDAPLTASVTVKDADCFGAYTGSITFEPSGGTGPYQYALDDKPYNGSRIQIGLAAGTYAPRLIDRNGCTLALAPVALAQRPALALDLGPDLTIRLGDSIQLFSDLSYAAEPVAYAWEQSGLPWLSCADCPDPWVRGLRFATYFALTVTDSLGCSATDRIRINVEKPRRLFVPTGFSPNGDGANDVLPVHGQADAKVMSFRIFDRWGELVYEGQGLTINDDASGWDGSFRGQAMPPGVYVWMLEAEYPDGEREILRGETTLIR